jgi:type I restriction enzyme, S subunit
VSLPKGWVASTIGEIAEVVTGKTPPTKQSELYGADVCFFKPGDLDKGGKLSRSSDRLSHEGLKFAPVIPAGALLVTCIGILGKSGYTADISTCNQQINAVLPTDAAKTEFLYYWSRTIQQWLKDNSSATTVSIINKGRFERAPINLPPLAEQIRIVAKLDLLTARLARARTELERVPILVQQMKRQALKACFESVDGNQVELGVLLRGIEAGKNMRCEERPPKGNELGVVKVSAVTWGRFDPLQSKTLPPNYVPPEKAQIHSGDLLISRANTLELVGAVVLVDDEPKGLFLSDKILRLVLDEDSKKWVLWFLRSPAGRKQIEDLATGNQLSMRNISQEALRRIRLPFPSTEIRRRLVDKLEAFFSRADRFDGEAARGCALLGRLESAILAKAFRGELVPQDPNDEPASVLLDKIRAQQDCASKAKSKRRNAITT